eukprot:TRINITY_DN90804_c0_g1_i1.p1 TRINITY_DN90804_c0_g1~~TRINITY_DN90804_c0_g1_i1.p1  ORF type:complete len:173 (-),score=49.91 TRINITY_DN90804_c0_g1_i1:52-570(-)
MPVYDVTSGLVPKRLWPVFVWSLVLGYKAVLCEAFRSEDEADTSGHPRTPVLDAIPDKDVDIIEENFEDLDVDLFTCGTKKYEWADWPKLKKEWCCRIKNIGCKTWCASLLDGPRGWTVAKREWCCLKKQVGCKREAFSCTIDAENIEDYWSYQKKVWCCEKKGVGRGCARH